MKNLPQIVLASKSARRRELLSNLGVEYEIFARDTDESSPDGISAEELVCGLASRKLHAVYGDIGEYKIIIAADTVVLCGDEIFGKPEDKEDARRMIKAMSGGYHEVYTGIAVSYKGKLTVEAECTKVHFRDISDAELDIYIDNASVTDKAGAYGIQEHAALFVDRIEGDYFNIVGLPVCRLGQVLRRDFGVELAEYGSK